MIPVEFYFLVMGLISIAVSIFLICLWSIADDLTKIRKSTKNIDICLDSMFDLIHYYVEKEK